MQRNNLFCRALRLTGIACLLWQTAASAADINIDNVTIGQLEAAQARNLLLEQQVQTARLQQQLRQSQSVNVNPVGTMAGPEYSSPSAQTVPDTSSGSTLQTSYQPERVRLQEIYGRAGELRARIALPRGGSTEVHRGDVIPGSKLTVTVVTPDIVRLSDGSELTF